MRLSLKKCEDVAFESYSALMYFFFFLEGWGRWGGMRISPNCWEKKWKISICSSICYSCSMETESMFFFFFSHRLINSFKDINLLRCVSVGVGWEFGAPLSGENNSLTFQTHTLFTPELPYWELVQLQQQMKWNPGNGSYRNSTSAADANWIPPLQAHYELAELPSNNRLVASEKHENNEFSADCVYIWQT